MVGMAGSRRLPVGLFGLIAATAVYLCMLIWFLNNPNNENVVANTTNGICDGRQFQFLAVNESERVSIDAKLKVTTETGWEKEALILMKSNSADGVTIITQSNNGSQELLLNWIASLVMNNYTKFLVFATDEPIYRAVATRGFRNNVVMVTKNWNTSARGQPISPYKSPTYWSLCTSKFLLANELLKRNFSILFSDSDIVFVQPGVVKFIRFEMMPKYLAYSSDYPHKDLNTGFYLARSSPDTHKFFGEISALARSSKNNKFGDQFKTNIVYNKNLEYTKLIHMLDPVLIQTGYVAMRIGRGFHVPPLVYHAAYLLNVTAKIQFFKDLNCWFL